jgi:hypothetical protein
VNATEQVAPNHTPSQTQPQAALGLQSKWETAMANTLQIGSITTQYPAAITSQDRRLERRRQEREYTRERAQRIATHVENHHMWPSKKDWDEIEKEEADLGEDDHWEPIRRSPSPKPPKKDQLRRRKFQVDGVETIEWSWTETAGKGDSPNEQDFRD